MNYQIQLSMKYYNYAFIFKPNLNVILQKLFDMGRSKQKKVQSEEQEEEEKYSIPEEEEEENLEDQGDDQHLDQFQVERRKQSDLLQIIAAQTKQGTDEEKLTWLALYSLKQKQIDLNQKMIQEVNALKDKYQLLKQPLFNKLASAALGKKVENQLYKPQGIQGTADPSKVTPAPLPQYWITVFEKSGLVQDQVDFQALRKLEDFSCELLNPKTSHLRLTFKFKQETAIFTNKILSLQVSSDANPESQLKIIIKDPIKYKGKKIDQSIFSELFNSQTAPIDTFNLANEFYRDYCNSIYYYMRKDDIDIIDVDADESQQKAPLKGSKKVKSDKPQKKKFQNPDCKQQ